MLTITCAALIRLLMAPCAHEHGGVRERCQRMLARLKGGKPTLDAPSYVLLDTIIYEFVYWAQVQWYITDDRSESLMNHAMV